jgi:hypothetical protein
MYRTSNIGKVVPITSDIYGPATPDTRQPNTINNGWFNKQTITTDSLSSIDLKDTPQSTESQGAIDNSFATVGMSRFDLKDSDRPKHPGLIRRFLGGLSKLVSKSHSQDTTQYTKIPTYDEDDDSDASESVIFKKMHKEVETQQRTVTEMQHSMLTKESKTLKQDRKANRNTVNADANQQWTNTDTYNQQTSTQNSVTTEQETPNNQASTMQEMPQFSGQISLSKSTKFSIYNTNM